MRCKAGDIVKIKTWKEMKKEYGLTHNRDIECKLTFVRTMEEYLNKNFPDRIVEIEAVDEKYEFYFIRGSGDQWGDDMIKEKVVYEPIKSRFDILDIR